MILLQQLKRMTGKLYTLRPGHDADKHCWSGRCFPLVVAGDKLLLISVEETANGPYGFHLWFLSPQGTLVPFYASVNMYITQKWLSEMFTDFELPIKKLEKERKDRYER